MPRLTLGMTLILIKLTAVVHNSSQEYVGNLYIALANRLILLACSVFNFELWALVTCSRLVNLVPAPRLAYDSKAAAPEAL